MTEQRAAGVLLHITSLPGGMGVGDLGPQAYRFIDWLHEAGQRYWQVLPVGPTGYGESPYQSPSSYAGNPLFVSLELLRDWGLCESAAIFNAPVSAISSTAAGDRVDWDAVRSSKLAALDVACSAFFRSAGSEHREAFEQFKSASENRWLHDYALFVVAKDQHPGLCWNQWPEALRRRDAAALAAFAAEHAVACERVKLEQFFFFSQWQRLRAYANERGVRLIGDCPIYVAHDSAEVWCAPELFDLDEAGNCRTVAGVPPDYFSATGQLWGNPLYRWDAMADDGYGWWCERLAHCERLYDLTRIDHFRGLDSYWEVDGDADTAIDGVWRDGPRDAFFDAIRTALGGLPLIAEDLGLLTDSVHELRERQGLLGMRVLQFGYDGVHDNPHFPGNVREDTIAYSATHDNDTTRGWLDACDEETRARAGGGGPYDPVDVVVEETLACRARLAIVPMQDLLRLPTSARFNEPGKVGDDNWSWRLLDGQASGDIAAAHRARTERTGRLPVELAVMDGYSSEQDNHSMREASGSYQ
ncbi:MAG: 4-alpha-glucanotransferase [Pseudomonadota bacterium]